MEVLDHHIARRRAIHALYTELLAECEGISVKQNPSTDFDSNFWLTCIEVDPAKCNGKTADDIRLHLESHNIESRLLWRPMHMQPVFADCPYYGDGTSERIFERGLCLPSGSSLTDEQITFVADTIKKFVRE
jgi:dTDP-4-amino-4,6-dideoxygalactose transaminase